MSKGEDEGNKPKLGSIPAPASVPRPSRPPTAVLRPSQPPRGITVSTAGTAGGSVPPASGRKGTITGVAPPSNLPPLDEEGFDAEKTIVVDGDDAPTADYDPRGNYNPRARGVYHTPASSSLTSPNIPSAPPPPKFDEAGVPEARPSEMARKRTSRRTVKIPDEQVREAQRAAGLPEAGSRDDSDPNGPSSEAAPEAADVSDRARDFDDETTEITAVRPFRIIDIGSEPPPPVRSPHATWPPASSYSAKAIEEGWTPAAPGVAAKAPEPEPVSAVATPVVEAVQPRPDYSQARTVPDPPRLPDDPVPAAAPRQAMSSMPEVVVTVPPDDLLEIEPDAAPLVAPPAPLAAAPAAAPKRPPPPPKTRETDPRKRSWFEDLFSDEYLRTHDRLEPAMLKREVDFIEESLGVEKHAVVLDLACGFGNYANELAARGYSVVASDLSSDMLTIAENDAIRMAQNVPGFVPPKFVREDMRDLDYEEAFDGAVLWSTSFGYFEDDKNAAVLQSLHRALRQGGMLLIDLGNRDYIASRAPSLVWFEGKRATCMDDMFMDFFTSRLRVKRTAMFEGGSSRELEYSIRLYALHEIGKLLHDSGFKVVEVTGHIAHPGVYFGAESPRMIVLAERS